MYVRYVCMVLEVNSWGNFLARDEGTADIGTARACGRHRVPGMEDTPDTLFW